LTDSTIEAPDGSEVADHTPAHMAELMSVARLVAEAEIRRTIAGYCQTCDDGRFAEFGEYFTEDAVLVIFGEEQQGRDAVVAWITESQPAELRGKHVTVNSMIDIDLDGERATGTTDFIFLGRSPDGLRIITAGRYLDEFTRAGERWLFARREITFFDDPRA
jgi:ketosteroid isomerase-like protein